MTFLQGCYEIISLSGTFVDKTPVGASVTGGLPICLSSSSGHLVGGLLGGPLTATNRVQVNYKCGSTKYLFLYTCVVLALMRVLY